METRIRATPARMTPSLGLEPPHVNCVQLVFPAPPREMPTRSHVNPGNTRWQGAPPVPPVQRGKRSGDDVSRVVVVLFCFLSW